MSERLRRLARRRGAAFEAERVGAYDFTELGRPISSRHAALISVADELARGWVL